MEESPNSNDNQSTRSSLRANNRYSTTGPSNAPVQTNLAGAVLNKTRYTMNFKVTADQRGTTGLVSFYTDIYKEMKAFCAEIVILPWNEEIHKGEIKTHEDIPTTITKIKQYFYGPRTHDAGGSVFSKIHLGFPITTYRTTFESDFTSFCKDRRITFYKTAVQHHNVKTACWLPYLTSCTNTVLLSKIMTDSFSATTGKTVPIGCVNRFLNSQRDTPEDEKVRAIHIECPSDSVAVVNKFSRSCSAQKIYPGGTRFRVMNEFWPYMTPENQEKYRYMVSRHRYFIEQLGTCTTSKIIEIDRKIPTTQMTLRSLLLGLRDASDNHRIFHSINLRWNTTNTWNITYRPDKRTLAHQYCNSFCTYVRHKFPEHDLTRLFTLDALDEAEEETYFPDTQTFRTQEDVAIQAELDQDADDDSMQFVDMSGLEPPTPSSQTAPVQEVRNPKLFNLTGDADTVSTMATEALSVTFQDHDADMDSTTSVRTTASASTRITRVEGASTQMRGDVASLRRELNEFMQSIRPTNTTNGESVVPGPNDQTTENP